jgi:hypothetical protein
MMSRAPASASAAVGTSFSASTNFAASSAGSAFWFSSSQSASGVSPRSMALVARVWRFGRKGAKMSSSVVSVAAASTFFFSSG